MKLRFIGTGSMSSVNNSASYLIDDIIAVDMPNGFCKNVMKIGIELDEIQDVLITHFHGDHYFDLPFYFYGLSKTENSTNIYLNKSNKRKVMKLFKMAFPYSMKEMKKNIKINYITEKHFKIGNYEIEKILVKHGRLKPAFGYIITNDNVKMGFTGDTSYCESVEKMASICDYLICDCRLKIGDNKHMGINNILDMAKRHKNHKFIPSHMSDNTRRKMEIEKIDNIIIPNDGDVIEIE